MVTLASPRCLHVRVHLGCGVRVHLRGGSGDKLARGGHCKMTGQKGDKNLENCPLLKDLNFLKALLSL